MKQNWIQLLSLILCLLVLVLMLGQNRKLEQRHEELENQVHDLHRMLSDEILSISSQMEQALEESNRLVANYTLNPQGIDQESHALLADVTVSLKEWYADTQLTLSARICDRLFTVPMEATEDGSFAVRLSLPLEEAGEISLSVQISGGSVTRREELGAWSDISMLLPLRSSGGGWDGPEYLDGTASSSFTIFIDGRSGMPGPIQNPRFTVYRNGDLVQTIPAVIDPYSEGTDSIAFTVDTEGRRWHLKCDIGDSIDIRFCCEDEYGLGYDFLFMSYAVDEEANPNYNGTTYQSGTSPLTLYWPE